VPGDRRRDQAVDLGGKERPDGITAEPTTVGCLALRDQRHRPGEL